MNNEINFEEFIKNIDCTIYEKSPYSYIVYIIMIPVGGINLVRT